MLTSYLERKLQDPFWEISYLFLIWMMFSLLVSVANLVFSFVDWQWFLPSQKLVHIMMFVGFASGVLALILQAWEKKTGKINLSSDGTHSNLSYAIWRIGTDLILGSFSVISLFFGFGLFLIIHGDLPARVETLGLLVSGTLTFGYGAGVFLSLRPRSYGG